jgi:hypothetical protein
MSDSEQQLFDKPFRKLIDVVPTKGKVFLYEVSQLSDPDNDRSHKFRTDLQDFLHLEQAIEPFIWFRPGRNHADEQKMDEINSMKINICDAKYGKLRAVLLHHSQQASKWMIDYFLHADGVIVSSKDYFADTILKEWEVDPCDRSRKRTKE